MPGVTEQEIAQAKQMNLYQYMQLCEPDNFKPEGPGQFRHKGHSSLTFAEDGSWTYFKTKATGRTALNYLIAVEGVSFAAPTILYEPKSSSARAYVEFTQEVLGHGREEQVYERDEDARDR